MPSPGWYLFQFHRVLQYARPRPGSPQAFFWMFVDNLVLTEDDRAVATRFLEVRAGAAVPGVLARPGPPRGTLGRLQGWHSLDPAAEAWAFRAHRAVRQRLWPA